MQNTSKPVITKCAGYIPNQHHANVHGRNLGCDLVERDIEVRSIHNNRVKLRNEDAGTRNLQVCTSYYVHYTYPLYSIDPTPSLYTYI